MKPKILYIDSDPQVGMATKKYLEAAELDVLWCLSAESAYNVYINGLFSMVLLETQLPDQDGFVLAQQILDHNCDAYMFFLTARCGHDDRLKGLRMGAVDYITKPFDLEEVTLRIKNIIRKQSVLPRPSASPADRIFRIGDVRFDEKKLSIAVGEDHAMLTLREAELFSYLCENLNIIVRREDILIKVWGSDDYFLGRSLDVFVSRLRKMLSKSSCVRLDNVYGVGFMLMSPE